MEESVKKMKILEWFLKMSFIVTHSNDSMNCNYNWLLIVLQIILKCLENRPILKKKSWWKDILFPL